MKFLFTTPLPPSQLVNGGSVERQHWCSRYLGVYYFLHLLNKSFQKNVSDLEFVKTDLFSMMYPDFNVWKKVGIVFCTG